MRRFGQPAPAGSQWYLNGGRVPLTLPATVPGTTLTVLDGAFRILGVAVGPTHAAVYLRIPVIRLLILPIDTPAYCGDWKNQ